MFPGSPPPAAFASASPLVASQPRLRGSSSSRSPRRPAVRACASPPSPAAQPPPSPSPSPSPLPSPSPDSSSSSPRRQPSTPPPPPTTPSEFPVEILARTDHWVAVNKPAGILVHRTKLYPSRRGEAFLQTLVRNHLAYLLNRNLSVFPVHRLDRPTTGILLLALDDSRNAALLQEALQSPTARKQYWSLAFGAHMEEAWANEHPLKDLVGRNRKQRPATTYFEKLFASEEADISVVRATLATGRRHQIRRHLSYSRFPVVGDTSHGDSSRNHVAQDKFGVTRCCLHARHLSFVDPFTKKPVDLHVPVPQDLRTVLEALPGYSPQLDSELDLDEPVAPNHDSDPQ